MFSSLVNFTNLKKLISNNTTLEIISKIKSGIKYDKETNIITFQIDEETNNNIKHQKKKSNIENEIFPDITHSHIKVNDSLELLAEIKF